MKRSSYIKENDKIVKNNIGTLLKFEILYKVMLGLIFLPVAVTIFNITMNFTGYKYLTIENILSFLLNPITITFLLVILVFLTLVTIFDLGTIIIIYDASYQNKKITLLDAIKICYRKCLKMIKPKNILLMFLVLFLIPFFNFGSSSNLAFSIKIPEFIMVYIRSNIFFTVLMVAVYLFFSFILIKWIFSLHYMILEDKSFKDASYYSSNLIKGNFIKDILKIIVVQLIYVGIYVLFLIIGILIIYAFVKIFSGYKIIESILISIVGLFILIYLLLASILANAVSYSLISVLFYMHKEEKNEAINNISIKNQTRVRNLSNRVKYVVFIALVFAIFGGSVFTYQILSGRANFNIEDVRNVEITAHRGSSIKYPENTMISFLAASEEGADFIEIDVQMSKDGNVVVCHDNNLSRVAGVNKNISELTYDEIKSYDVGFYFNEKYVGEKIPLLTEVIEFAIKNNIRLNIEIKQNDNSEIEKKVIDIINQYSFNELCVVSSSRYKVLKKIKKIDKNIKTSYVMSIAIGDISSLKYADVFSLEATNVTKKQVHNIHNAGKEVYAWTVNSEDSINKMIEFGVDSIITDNVVLGRRLVLESRSSELVTNLIKRLNKIILF